LSRNSTVTFPVEAGRRPTRPAIAPRSGAGSRPKRAEQLVRPLAREHDLHVLARGFGEQIRRKDGGIADRLRDALGHGIQRAEQGRVVGGHHVVHRAHVTRDGGSEVAFVIARLRESHRVGMDALVGQDGLRRRGEPRGVETAAREHPQRDVRHQLAADGAEQRLAQHAGTVEP
jgi:hypothetical protein